MEINIVGQFEDNEEIHEVLKIAKLFVIEERIQNITENKTQPNIQTNNTTKPIKKHKTQKNINLFSVLGLN